MALVDCPECGHKVSNKAQACPSCGFAVAENAVASLEESDTTKVRPRRRQKIVFFSVLYIVLVGVLAVWFHDEGLEEGSQGDASDQGVTSTQSAPTSAPRCLEPTEEFKSELITFLPKGSEFLDMAAVRDASRNNMYYVAAEIQTPNATDTALFATTAITEFGMMQAANDIAADISTMFDARETQVNASERNPVAEQAVSCLGQNQETHDFPG